MSSFKISILLSIIYLLDEKINTIVGVNSFGFIILLILYFFNYSYIKIPHKLIKIFVFILFYLIFISYLSPCELNYKSIFSILLLLPLMLVINRKFINKIVNSNFTSKMVLIFFIISIISNDVFSMENRALRLFYENSWIALYISPFIIYRLLSNSKDRYSWMAIVVISIYCFSSTFFILMSLLFLVISVKTNKMIYIIFSALLMLLYFSINNIALIDRFDTILNYDSSAAGNLSSYVWLNGFSMAYQNFITSSGLGVGLNLMGCTSSTSVIGFLSPVIEKITGGVLLNSEDGSFLSAKLVSELGFLGLLIVLVIVAISIRNIALYIFKKSNSEINLDCIVGSIVMLILLFVRAGGYFQLITILSLSLLFSGSKTKKVDLTGIKE